MTLSPITSLKIITSRWAEMITDYDYSYIENKRNNRDTNFYNQASYKIGDYKYREKSQLITFSVAHHDFVRP